MTVGARASAGRGWQCRNGPHLVQASVMSSLACLLAPVTSTRVKIKTTASWGCETLWDSEEDNEWFIRPIKLYLPGIMF